MQNFFVMTPEEKRELKSIADVLSVVAAQFDSATDPDDDDTCKTVEEMKNYMAYGISYLEKAENVLRIILSGNEIDPSTSVKDFEITQ